MVTPVVWPTWTPFRYKVKVPDASSVTATYCHVFEAGVGAVTVKSLDDVRISNIIG
jgi:hypothetical protein